MDLVYLVIETDWWPVAATALSVLVGLGLIFLCLLHLAISAYVVIPICCLVAMLLYNGIGSESGWVFRAARIDLGLVEPAALVAEDGSAAVRQAVKDAEGRLSQGAIVVDMPFEAKEGDVFEVRVRISRADLDDVDRVLAALNASQKAAIAEPMQVASRMYVDVASPDNAFDIKRKAPQTRQQILPDSGVAIWAFSVLAQEAGRHPITVEAGVAARIMDEDTTISWHPFSKDITVTVSEMWRGQSFIDRNWQILLTALVGAIVAGFGYLLKRWWEKKHAP
ncbi:MAG: hypothetical protein ABWY00_05470 [Dongiaceae bacterium]